MAVPRDRIFTIAEAILAAVLNGLMGEGVNVPTRAFVSAGQPALDGIGEAGCSMLAVWTDTIDRDITGGQDPNNWEDDNAKWLMRTCQYTVTLARCSAVMDDQGNPPTVDAEEKAARGLYGDATSILNAVAAGFQAGLITGCHGLGYAGAQIIGPSGGAVAVDVRFDVSLTGL